MIGEAQAVKVGLSRAHSKVAAAWSDVNENVAVVAAVEDAGRSLMLVSGCLFATIAIVQVALAGVRSVRSPLTACT